MPKLLETLLDYELDFLTIIAHRWDVDLEARSVREASEELTNAMLDPERAAYEWSRLGDRERAALQMLLASPDHKMPLAKYARLFGEVRQMGSEKRQREKPHLAPLGIAETLYYRGLVALFYDQGAAGTQHFIYVPSDLAQTLPSHETGYDLTKADEDDDIPIEEEFEYGETELLHRADTALVDDVATLLAYLQVEEVRREGSSLSEFDRQAIEDYLLGGADVPRIHLMMALITELDLAMDSPVGIFKPIPANARRWLDQSRTKQVKSLVQAWQDSTLFNELAHLGDLVLEGASWQNDPRLIRQTIQKFLKQVSDNDWFATIELVNKVKSQEPDFQRPAADYTSWYIRDAETDEYLTGFANWDRVDGAVLHFALLTPMHCLGLLDVGESDIGDMVRLSAYGRAFAKVNDFPERDDPEATLEIDEAGVLRAPRSLSRYDRFQLARFTDWGMPSDPYEYALTANSLSRAEKQGIKTEHIRAFLSRTSRDKIPESALAMLEQWEKTGGSQVVLSHLDVLETDTETALDSILETPDLRRFLGKRLGGRAVVVRSGQWDALLKALHERGILADEE
jgi:Helicase conserved C-terminal domain